MNRKHVIGFLILLIGLQAAARVPYAKLEILRRQSVVVRMALDSPESPILKKCNLKSNEIAGLGGRLNLAMDKASEAWKLQSLTESDLETLKGKIKVCADRGSCQVYEAFLSNVKPATDIQNEVTELGKNLNATLEKLDSSTYQKALSTVADPCGALDSLDVL